jgi:hypothetical protein
MMKDNGVGSLHSSAAPMNTVVAPCAMKLAVSNPRDMVVVELVCRG